MRARSGNIARRQRGINQVFQPAIKVYVAQISRIPRIPDAARMTAMTSEELGITSPAERAAAARRRDATRRVRWARDKLTSTSGTPAFDYELLRQFAQNRISASVAILLLIATVGFLSSLWAGVVLAGAWTLAVVGTHGITTPQ